VSDFSENAWFQCFNEGAIAIMGREAKELLKLRDENVELYEECFDQACLNSFVFRCRAKTEIYNEQTRIRYTVTGIAPVDYAARARELYQEIEMMSN
ncbi:22736_t:CDS:2, partial [Racocetra persica]